MSYEIPFFSLMAYLVRAVFLISAGIIVVNILAETGIFEGLKKITRPLCKVSGLSEGSVLSVITMTINSMAGKSMLAEYYRDQKVSKKEIVPTLLVGTFPTVIGESLFRVQLPTAIILLGPVVGLIYTMFNIFSTFLQALCAIIYTHLFLRNPICENHDGCENEIVRHKREKITKKTVKAGFEKSLPKLKEIIPITTGAILIFYLLSLAGLMDIIAMLFDPILNLIGLPGESTAALVAQFMHFSAGYTIVGSLMETGILNMEQALVTLISGSMVVITMIYVKYTFPLNIALFGKEGVPITYKTYAISMTAKVICIIIVMILF